MTSRTKKVRIDNMDRLKSESEKKNDEKMMKSPEAERNYCRKTFVFELEMTFDTSGLAEATVKNKIEAVRKNEICSAIVGEREREKGRARTGCSRLFFFILFSCFTAPKPGLPQR